MEAGIESIYDCIIAEVTTKFGAVKLLECNVWVTKAWMKSSVRALYRFIRKYQEEKVVLLKSEPVKIKLTGNICRIVLQR